MTHFGRPGLPFQNATGRHKLTRETLSVTATLTFYVAYCIHYPTPLPGDWAAARIGSASLVMYPYVGCCIYHLTHLTNTVCTSLQTSGPAKTSCLAGL